MHFETWSEKILVTLGAMKCALLLAFFASFGLIEPEMAKAESTATCEGVNLVEKLKTEEPEVYAKINQEASAVKNGEHKYWKIEREGYPDSYLFGTMHMADPKIATLSLDVKSAIKNSDKLVVESVDALDPTSTQREMGKLAHLTLLQKGTLRDLVHDDLEDELETSLSARGLPMMLADRMQPWVIATMVSIPVCELQRKQTGVKVLDSALAEFAQNNGKPVEGLESVEEQLTAMASLPTHYHVSALEETLAGGSLSIDMIETLKAVYQKGNMGIVFPLMKAVAPKSYSGEGAAEFQAVLIENRNKLMLERVLPKLKTGKTFVAVGALHLPGDMGLVNLLEQDGFTLSPVKTTAGNG